MWAAFDSMIHTYTVHKSKSACNHAHASVGRDISKQVRRTSAMNLVIPESQEEVFASVTGANQDDDETTDEDEPSTFVTNRLGVPLTSSRPLAHPF